MKRSHQKNADDVIVSDADAGIRRLQNATRHILSVPKSATNSHPIGRKNRRRKK